MPYSVAVPIYYGNGANMFLRIGPKKYDFIFNPYDEVLSGVVKWCKKTFGDAKMSQDETWWYDSYASGLSFFYFKNEEDKMMFKLRWCY